MKVRLVSWAGSLLLHATVLVGIMLISSRLQQPLQIELFDFALLPVVQPAEQPAEQPAVQPADQDAVITETRPKPPSPPKQNTPPQAPAKPVRPKPAPAVVAESPAPRLIEPVQPVEVPSEPSLPPTEIVEAAVPTQQLPAPTVSSSTAVQPQSAPATTTASRQATAIPPAEMQQRYLAAQFSYIRDKVMNTLAYPVLGRRMGWTGQVKISFLILKNGDVEKVVVVESSGHSLLDRAAVQAVRKAAPFPPPPAAAKITLPVAFRLT